jgi:serine/threonine-protein kinase
VRHLDSGCLDVGPFLAMELIEGRTLKETMAKGRLPVDAAIAIVTAVADTLGELHRVQVVHRDVKPGNVILRGGKEPVLMDLGVAALTMEDRAPGGDLLGSPGYMAPELIEDRPWGPAADVFSLGVMLYMLLTDRRPFSGSPDEVMERIRRVEPLPPSSVDPGLPRELDDVVARVLAKNPAERWPADVLARALRRLSGTQVIDSAR